MKLSVKVAVFVSCFIISAVAISVGVTQHIVRTSIDKSISKDQVRAATQTMDKIDRFLYERTIDMQLIAATAQLAPSNINPSTANRAEATKQLNNIKTLDGVWDFLSIFTPDQTIVVSTNQQTLSTADTTTTKNAFQEALQGSASTTDVFRDSQGQVAQYFFAPIRSSVNQQVVGVVGGRLSWPSVLEITRSIKDSTVMLISSKGIEIGNNDQKSDDVLRVNVASNGDYKSIISSSDTSGSFIGHQFDEIHKPLIAYAKEEGFLSYSGHNWSLANAVASSEVFAPAYNVTLMLLVIFGGIMLLALGMILLFVERQVINPVRSLLHAVEGITGGDWSKRVHLKSHDELGSLGEAFNTMAAQLSIASTELNDEKARLEASINSLPLGFLLTNSKNTIITMNPLIRNMIGQKKLEKLSTAPAAVTLDLLERILSESADCLANRRIATLDYTSKQGRVLKLFFSPVLEGTEAIGVVTLVEDITEAKVLERAKEEFFSIASHELRTPLTAIRGNASMIEQFYSESIKDADLHEMVDDIKKASVRLIEIVNDFLDTSRLEQGKMAFNLEMFDISEVIEGVTYEMSAMIKDKNVYLRADLTLHNLPHVYADKDRVKQIIYNLVGNALKFTEKGGITIYGKPEGTMLRVSVSDTGRGIPADKLALLFRKFQQAGNSLLTRDTTRGTGLGLYISKLLTEKMGGELSLDSSEVGKGTVFSFTLPLQPPADEPPVTPEVLPPAKIETPDPNPNPPTA